MNTKSGFTEINIEGDLVPLKFGMNAFLLFCELRGIELDQLDKVLAKADPGVLRDMTFCGNKAASLSRGIEPFFKNKEEIGDLLDENPGFITAVVEAMMNARVFGQSLADSPAPKKKGSPPRGTT